MNGQDSVGVVRGIGAKKQALLKKLSICTLHDAQAFYPRDYEDRTNIVPISELTDGQKAAIYAVVETAPETRRIRQGLELTRVRVCDSTGRLWLTYYNNPYGTSLLHVGGAYIFYGKIQRIGPVQNMVAPVSEPVRNGVLPPRRLYPIYPLTAGLTQRDMQRVAEAALAVPAEPEWLPEDIMRRNQLLSHAEALRQIHQPQTVCEVQAARRRLIFEELFLLCCGLARLKDRRTGIAGLSFSEGTPEDFWKLLPFAPTGAQRRAAQEIWQDVQQGRPMNRLVQGDVGSGKTVLAAVLCYLAAQNGYQSAIMAPTEILAAQHMESLAPIFEQVGIQCILLLGSMSAKQKAECKATIAAGAVQVVIGTHALIQKDVSFDRLGAVVVDEQHRFGVAQRAMLHDKGQTPHVLVMSATPIPRTLALILYGDLDVSVVDELPPGRTPVPTFAVGESMRQRIEAFIEKQIRAGGQVYIVCPRVEEGELPVKSAEAHNAALQKSLPHRRIAVLHGKMKAAEKEAVMHRFAAGALDILVATTVIEVGVNVPNASLMVIEDADRFGLSQLHQLRGRVGRGTRQSYCICFGADKGEQARERLSVLCSTNDGFEIARADLAHRGPGDFFGKRQHGLPMLRLADLAADLTLLQAAKDEADDLLTRDPLLLDTPALRERVQQMFSDRAEEIFN